MADNAWHVTNEGAWRRLDGGAEAVDLKEWDSGDRSTITGGQLVLGHLHGVRARSEPPQLNTC